MLDKCNTLKRNATEEKNVIDIYLLFYIYIYTHTNIINRKKPKLQHETHNIVKQELLSNYQSEE